MSEFDKIDRALEAQIIDWLQWSNLNQLLESDDHRMAQLTLSVFGKLKRAYNQVQTENDQLKEDNKRLKGIISHIRLACIHDIQNLKEENAKLEKELANLKAGLEADMRLAIDSYLVTSLLPGVDEQTLEEIKKDLKQILLKESL